MSTKISSKAPWILGAIAIAVVGFNVSCGGSNSTIEQYSDVYCGSVCAKFTECGLPGSQSACETSCKSNVTTEGSDTCDVTESQLDACITAIDDATCTDVENGANLEACNVCDDGGGDVSLDGTWTCGQQVWVINAAGTFVVNSPQFGEVSGTYKTSGDQMAITDTGGNTSCPSFGVEGTYRFEIVGDGLFFSEANDPTCVGRRLAILSCTSWVKQ